MAYKRPIANLHREFTYLNHDSIINSLSAMEDGRVDEIIEKASQAREGGFNAGAQAGPIRGGGSKKKAISSEEQLVRKRTMFSAFDAWHSFLESQGGFGEFDSWDLETRNELAVGDTLRFRGFVELNPVYKVLLTFISYANDATNPDSPFKQPAAKVAELKKQARMMRSWLADSSGNLNQLVHIQPLDFAEPRVIARIDENYLLDGAQGLEGEYTIVAQVEQLVDEGYPVPIARVVRDIPPTPKETETMTNALSNFQEGATALGVTIEPEDLSISHPAVILKPIALFR